MQDLDKFKNEMNLSGKNVYVGHRYVPKIFGEWDNSKLYEPLSIVQYQGNSFTSRQYVPVGVELTNEEFWVSTGNYNAQVEQYRQDVRNLDNEVINARQTFTTLGDRLNSMDSVIKEYVKLSDLDLSKTDGVYNFEKITSKITGNNIVLFVDDVYPIETSETFELIYDLNIDADKNGELILSNKNDTPFFDVKSNLDIQNVKISSVKDNVNIFMANTSEGYTGINKVYINNIKTNGNIRLLDINKIPYINSVDVYNNTVENTKYSFFNISEAEIDVVNIKYNRVKNWFYRCFNVSNTADNGIREINFENNIGENDDYWVLSQSVEPYTYYVFALFKANVINYSNNNVSGMKSTSSINLYDLYAEGDVNYDNNIFKNNVCFSDSTLNVLMKPKAEDSVKAFKNSKFIIEDSFISKFGYDPNTFKVKLYDVWGGDETTEHTKPVEYTILNNLIEVPNLVLESSRRLVKSFVFENNKIKTKTMRDFLVNTRQEQADISMKNNVFNVLTDTTYYQLVGNNADEQVKLNSITIDGNKFYKGMQSLVYATAKVLSINNNLFVAETTTAARLINAGKYDYISTSNNVYLGSSKVEIINSPKVVKQIISSTKGTIGNASLVISELTGNKKIDVVVESGGEVTKFTLKILNDMLHFTDVNSSDREVSLLDSSINGVGVKSDNGSNSTLILNVVNETLKFTVKPNTETILPLVTINIG